MPSRLRLKIVRAPTHHDSRSNIGIPLDTTDVGAATATEPTFELTLTINNANIMSTVARDGTT